MKTNFTQNKERPEKKHNFEYLNSKNYEIKQKLNSLDSKTVIKNELTLVTMLGSGKKDYDKFLRNEFIKVFS